MEIDSPSIVELSGKNGVGKTTLLSILGGICSFSGTILYDEINLKNNYDSYMQKSIFISNSPFMYDYLTVKEMIDFINDLAIPSIEWKEELSILFEDLSLKRYENVFIKDLSLGTAQKVSIERSSNKIDSSSLHSIDGIAKSLMKSIISLTVR